MSFRPPRVFTLALVLAFLPSAKTFAAELPENSGWKVYQTVPALFPQRMLQRGLTDGGAYVRVSVLPTSELADALVIASTELEFGTEALRVARLWRYQPPRVDGKPIGVVGDIRFRFQTTGTVAIIQTAADKLPTLRAPDQPYRDQAVELRDLDGIPSPAKIVQPIYPQEWIDRGMTGQATIEFYIDETGRVRVPCVLSATNDLLGGSAVAAISQWKFEPPMRRGQRALVRVEQVFTFDPAKAKAPDAKR